MPSAKSWLQKNRKYLKPLVAMIVVFFLTVVAAFYSIVLLSKDALKALIEAEATIFGFFGVITFYMLKVYDDKIERYQRKQSELENTGKSSEPYANAPKIHLVSLVIDEIRENKKRTVRYTSRIATVLFISIVLSVWLLGFMDFVLTPQAGISSPIGIFAALLSGVTISIFFLGAWFLFGLFKSIAEET